MSRNRKIYCVLCENWYVPGLDKDCCENNHILSFNDYLVGIFGEEYVNECNFDAFKERIRNRTRSIFKRIGKNKPTKTENILGSDWETIKLYFEELFTDGMCWGNIHRWHIDHVIPLKLAKTVDDVYKLCHYTNLQPLWAYDNLAKNAKTDYNIPYSKHTGSPITKEILYNGNNKKKIVTNTYEIINEKLQYNSVTTKNITTFKSITGCCNIHKKLIVLKKKRRLFFRVYVSYINNGHKSKIIILRDDNYKRYIDYKYNDSGEIIYYNDSDSYTHYDCNEQFFSVLPEKILEPKELISEANKYHPRKMDYKKKR